tara:strand:- start:502 stop:1944 length:1443 start_codon:yes stop_codon:yes gene_type:complete
MRLNEIIRYFLRFLILQIILTLLTIFYFDNFLIGDYQRGYELIIFNLIEDRDRFYTFIPNSLIKIDLFLGFFIFIFLLILYSTKFYTYVNELTFSTSKKNLDEFFSIYLLWTSCLFVFMMIFRFNAISRFYLVLFTFIVPTVLVVLRNSESLSSLLGRSPINENYISFNLDEHSIFKQLRIISMRNSVGNYDIEVNTKSKEVIDIINDQNKESNVNLIILNLNKDRAINDELLNFLININKKVLLLSENNIEFQRYFIKRTEKLADTFLNYFNNDIQYGAKYILKRAMDISLTIIGILLTLPISILISIYIVLIDGMPFLIRQERIGLHGKKFMMYKFRTMHKDAHSKREDLLDLNQRDDILFKIEDDPRLLKKSSFLRRFSLDEIPQFFNVIKGDMSLVGPRPLFKEDTAKYDTNYMRRLNVLPGITGLLQISDRNAPEFETWYKYDIEYIENWSLGLDLKIILKTPFSLIKNKNTKGI